MSFFLTQVFNFSADQSYALRVLKAEVFNLRFDSSDDWTLSLDSWDEGQI